MIANEAIIAQMDASIEAIEASDDPSPSIMFSNANLDENAIIFFDIDSGGTGYNGDGEITAAGTTGGTDFMATYTENGGVINSVTIVRYGLDYTGTISFSIAGDTGTPMGASFKDEEVGNALFANLTNDGQTSIDVDDMWVSADGDEPEKLSPDSYSAFGTFFPTETIAIIYLEGLNGLSSTVTSMTITADGAVATESNL